MVKKDHPDFGNGSDLRDVMNCRESWVSISSHPSQRQAPAIASSAIPTIPAPTCLLFENVVASASSRGWVGRFVVVEERST